MTDPNSNPLVPEREFGTGSYPTQRSVTGEASPYSGFQLPVTDLKPLPQVDALREDPEIAGYLQDNSPKDWNRRRLAAAGIGFILTLAALAAVFVFAPGNMFRTYAPPPPRDTPKPQPYSDMAALPILFRDAVRDINMEIGDGNRWQYAFDKLRAFLADADAGKISPPDDVLRWARQEMLVILASKEIPPGGYPEAYPDDVFARFRESADAGGESALPFRGGSAYARILASRPISKDRKDAAEQQERLTGILEALRAAHPELLDNNRELLAIEAENHIRQLPREYVSGDQYLDYHWRRSAHAIVRLYDLYGRRDPSVRQIDRRRWNAVYHYFDLTLFTWDPKRIGRLKSIRLDDTDYTREQIRRELENL